MARTRKEMIEETRHRLVAAGRQAFAAKGYADSSMDDLTANVGLTRGALYHHFGDKKGLLEAVIQEIDKEMSVRLRAITRQAESTWQGFINESIAYMEMAIEPEIQRIVLLDGPAVLGNPAQWSSQNACIQSTMKCLQTLQSEGVIKDVEIEATSRLLNGATLSAALWIAADEQPLVALEKAIHAFVSLANGLLKH
ncbi:TetR family transcriptional regulator [Pseudomonas endophytica]|uniref:TetR family transcriptional regulator n=1 Tax=Pseudomonas endophytica TaxID=1563157 RepID=A0A0Q0X4Y5_9PSED|nr:TetR/AcrR family transcriptional regulator [Pseudomonas endophytica]KQB52166.1 TetR family transcriptional regulator [Pseudomonas endophytica]